MAPITNGRTLFNEIPTGYPEPGKTTVHDVSQTIDLENEQLNGGFIVKTLFISVDPYLRGRMRPADVPSYLPAFPVGQPIANYGIGFIVRSENAALQAGDHIYGLFPFQEYFVRSDPSTYKVLKDEGVPWSVYLGAAGMPGLTAYTGWKEFSHAKQGETIFISTAAGPVGSFVIQLAKLEGLKVIASAGSDEKVAFARSLGADVAFNYKTESTEEVLKREGGIDIYWDHVGGETLDLALAYANRRARFIECGMITEYNGPNAYNTRNLGAIVTKEISINGFLITHRGATYRDQFYKEVPKLIKEGKIKYKEDITRGLENAGQALLDQQQGKNFGKTVILVASE